MNAWKAKVERYSAAIDSFVERLREDRYVLAAVLVGSISEAIIWRKESLGMWLIEADGTTKRILSDGKDERILRTLVEDDINIHAELIPRSRFKLMIEGASRTAFSCNFFQERRLLYSTDPSIETWFAQAQTVATKDQARELFSTLAWVIHMYRHARKLFEHKGDLELTKQQLLGTAYGLAAIEIILDGEVYEEEIIYRALETNPELFQVVYLDLLSKRKTKKHLGSILERIEAYLEERGPKYLRPLTDFLKKEQRVVPFSEVCDHFAHTQLYPWHLESACEWLQERGRIEKFSVPFALTKKSRVEVEEPGYFFDGT